MMATNSPTLQRFRGALKEEGMRITPQRMAICQLLDESREHPTAAQIFERLKQQYPSLSLMTVYNTLNVLVRMGMVNELGSITHGSVHYDGDTSPHINLACVSCHRIMDLDCQSVSKLFVEVAVQSGYKIHGSRLLFYGLCPDCQKA